MFGWGKRQQPKKLHIGAGQQRLEGWINIDNQHLRGIDRVLDVRKGLPFKNVSHIFAEHFLEHLTFDEGRRFLVECRRVLRPDGILRLSTPNLDWVWVTQYHLGSWADDGEAIRDCFRLNRGFRGWGHQFLYNLQTLTETLRDCGFDRVTQQQYGESDDADLRSLERHEKYDDSPELSHIIVVEATGVRTRGSALLTEPLKEYRVGVESK